MNLSDLYFGDLEAFDEANNEKSFFDATFILPQSLSILSLRNNRRFIVVGRKGAGKTAVQMHLAKKLSDQGFYTAFFRFSDDLRADDYTEISRTQTHIYTAQTTNDRSLFLNYDFRDVWERTLLTKIANLLKEEGVLNRFTEFLAPDGSKLQNIFAGISRSLSLKLKGNMGVIAAEAGLDLTKLNNPDEISLKEFNRVARHLFTEHCREYRLFFFVDELVFSKLDAQEDEVRIRAAMVRDIVKTVCDLNNLCVRNDLDFHFICTLRPEIRNLINDYDSEIGKVVDGKDVLLSWYIDNEEGTPLLDQVFMAKVRHAGVGVTTKEIDFDNFVDKEISFGSITFSLTEFLKVNTWGRPRDVVRLLLAIAKKSPHASRIGEAQIKAALGEYSRASAKELVDELSVSMGPQILHALRTGIRQKTYHDVDDFLRSLPLTGVDESTLATELFDLGVIGGFQPETGNHFWAHRGESHLPPAMQVRVHSALWNEFSIRGYE